MFCIYDDKITSGRRLRKDLLDKKEETEICVTQVIRKAVPE